MPGQHMLDDGEAKAGAARFTRTAAIDTVKALGQARQMRRRDAYPGVDNDEFGGTFAPLSYEVYLAVLRRVAHGVAGEVAKGAAQLVGAAANDGRLVHRERDFMPPCRQGLRVSQDAL